MTRKLLILSLAVLMALPNLVFASGGANPGLLRSEKITGPTFSATVVVDARNTVGLEGRWATVRIKKGPAVSGIVFTVAEGFPFENYGCSLISPTYSDLTEFRFLYVPLIDWIPGTKIQELFAAVGIAINPDNGQTTDPNNSATPVISSVDNSICVPPYPDKGTLSFDAVIQFKVVQP